jgi:hypothetical protein
MLVLKVSRGHLRSRGSRKASSDCGSVHDSRNVLLTNTFMIAAKVQWLVFWEVIVGEARQKKEYYIGIIV